MRRSLVFLLVAPWCVLGWLTPSTAQVLRLSDESAPEAPKAVAAAKEDAPNEFTLVPQAEVSPAFRYQFWVPPIRREPGSAMAHLLRAFVMVQDIGNVQKIQDEWNEKESQQPDDLPLAEFPVEEARAYLKHFQHVLDELEQAERVEHIDYDFRIKELRGTAIFSTRLPELQHARDLGRLVKLQARLAIAEGRYDDAIQSLRVGFRLSEIVSSMGHSFLIGKLVAVAINMMMLDEVATLVQQPGAPNLYWALASLPDDIGEMRNALEGERVAFENTLYRVMELPSEPISAQAWQNRIVATASDVMQLTPPYGKQATDSDQPEAQMTAGAIILVYGLASQEALRDEGYSPEALVGMSYAEACVRMTRQGLVQLQSEYYKWLLVPRGDADINGLAEQYLTKMMFHDRLNPATVLGGLLLPAIQSAQSAGDRVLTERNQLITIEAIRAHAAAHENRLPPSLEKLEPLPAWRQAGTGKPFQYERISDTEAVLRRDPRWPRGDRDAEMRLKLVPKQTK